MKYGKENANEEFLTNHCFLHETFFWTHDHIALETNHNFAPQPSQALNYTCIYHLCILTILVFSKILKALDTMSQNKYVLAAVVLSL